MEKLTPVAELTAGVTVRLAGSQYILPPASFAALKRHTAELAKFEGRQLNSSEATQLAEVQLALVLAALQRNYPAATQEWLEDAIGIEQVRDLYAAAMNAAGLQESGADARKMAASRWGSRLGSHRSPHRKQHRLDLVARDAPLRPADLPGAVCLVGRGAARAAAAAAHRHLSGSASA